MALTNEGARFHVLRAMCAAAEGAVCLDRPDLCITAALRDRVRFAALGGRAGWARLLNSVYAMRVLLFCGATFRAVPNLWRTLSLHPRCGPPAPQAYGCHSCRICTRL